MQIVSIIYRGIDLPAPCEYGIVVKLLPPQIWDIGRRRGEWNVFFCTIPLKKKCNSCNILYDL